MFIIFIIIYIYTVPLLSSSQSINQSIIKLPKVPCPKCMASRHCPQPQTNIYTPPPFNQSFNQSIHTKCHVPCVHGLHCPQPQTNLHHLYFPPPPPPPPPPPATSPTVPSTRYEGSTFPHGLHFHISSSAISAHWPIQRKESQGKKNTPTVEIGQLGSLCKLCQTIKMESSACTRWG